MTTQRQTIDDKHQARLPELKKYVEAWYQYFKDNNRRYKDFMRFVFDTSLTPNEKSKLKRLSKPAIEFNVLEAYISRLRGEFAEQEPSLMVRVADGVASDEATEELTKTVGVIEDYIREIFNNSDNDNFEYATYSDCLAGGFSIAEIYTDYINEMSFEQNIHLERVFDPTLAGFDPMAVTSHKGDGLYCFKVVPKTKEDFVQEYGEEALERVNFARNTDLGSFSWSYQNQDSGASQKILLIASLWIKEKKKEKIVKISNGKVLLKKHYKDLIAHTDESGLLMQPPVIIEERESILETICRYDFCESKVIGYYETSDRYLPLVFIDGNSVLLQDKETGPTRQMTRPYVYHAKGIQQLKNFAGQSVANEIETMVQHKWIASIESIPDKYKDAYKNPQQAQVLVYNAFDEKNPDKALPPPREIQRTPTPQIVQEVFMGSDQVTQAILGSYDAQLGITDGNISGKAIQQGAIHSNAAAVPYVTGFYKGLNRIATIILDLIPKYYITPRSLPIRKANGIKDYQIVNDPKRPESVSLKYDPNSLQVKIEAGVNTGLQKQMALTQIIQLMQASEIFAKFINTQGLETILDNVDIRGIDELKVKAKQFMQAEEQAAQQQKPDPMQQAIEAEVHVETMRIQQKAEQAEGEIAIKSAQVAVDHEKADTERLKVLAELNAASARELLDAEKHNAALSRDAIKTALEIAKHHAEQSKAVTEQMGQEQGQPPQELPQQ